MNLTIEHIIERHLFDGVQRGRYGNGRHDDDGCGEVVVVLEAPQDDAEQLEDVEGVEHLEEHQSVREAQVVVGDQSSVVIPPPL